MKIPKISVIIPVYNAEKYILSAIQSILDQEYPNVEIIAVNDGSSDRSIDLLNGVDTPVNIVHQSNAGPAAARNTGLKHAIGDYVAFLDADDLYPSNKFRIQLDYFDRHPEVDIVAGRIQYIFLEGSDPEIFDFVDENQSVFHVHLGSMLTRRSVFDKIGFFEASLRFSEDIEWWLRIRENEIPYVILPDITLQYRLHDTNMTNEVKGIERDLMRALRFSLIRRRKTGKMHLSSMSDKKIKE